MATATTIKITEETRTALQELQKAHGFGSMEELQRHLAELAKSTVTADKVTALAPAIKCVDEFTDRLRSILNATGEAVLTESERNTEVLNHEKANFEKTLAVLRDKIAELEKQLNDNNTAALTEENSRLTVELEATKAENTKLKLEHASALEASAKEYATKLEQLIAQPSPKTPKAPTRKAQKEE